MGQVSFPFGPLSLLYLFPSLVKVSLKTLTLSSSCLLTPTPAAPVSALSLSLLLYWLVLLFAVASRRLLQPSS